MSFLGHWGLIFSPQRAIGITQKRMWLARKTGIPLSKEGIQRKVGSKALKAIGIGGRK